VGDPVAEHSLTQQRLLDAALEIFASKGYEGASTREICRLGGVNVAAIHYHFGDKASLYRAVFRIPEPLQRLPPEIDDPNVPVRTALAAFYRHLMAFMVAPQRVQWLRLLFLREELRPSGVLDEQHDASRRMHAQMVSLLCRATGARSADAALHQLAFSIGGLALVLFAQRSAVEHLAPELLADGGAVAATVERLTEHGLALIEAEAARRAASARASREAVS
jgi:TetR/AcrR family transcriptional regulator, regulator of cefoperazone and chloramphenicol sensitivity